jgi:adhesin HecA-like repeat protein
MSQILFFLKKHFFFLDFNISPSSISNLIPNCSTFSKQIQVASYHRKLFNSSSVISAKQDLSITANKITNETDSVATHQLYRKWGF